MSLLIHHVWGEPLALTPDPESTVGQFKDLLQECLEEFLRDDHNMNADTLHLIHAGNVLDDASRFSQLHLEMGAVLVLLTDSLPDMKGPEIVSQLGIFSLKTTKPDCQQENLAAYINLLTKFKEYITWPGAAWRPKQNEITAFELAVAVLDNEEPAFPGKHHVTWYWNYGCALLATVPRVGVVHLCLVCLDEWSFRVHSAKHKRIHTADANQNSAKSLYVGKVALKQYFALLNRATDLLSQTKRPKSPPAVKLALLDALKNFDEPSGLPCDGFTDLKLARNTSWPLVRAVIQTLLEQAGYGLFVGELTAQLKLWMAEVHGHLCSVKSYQTAINTCMDMISEAAKEGATLAQSTEYSADPGHKQAVTFFAARCVLVRWRLEQKSAQLGRAIADQFRLPPNSWEDLGCTDLAFSPPASTAPVETSAGLREAQGLAKQNLGWLPEPPPDDMWLLQPWLMRPELQAKQGAAAQLLVLETVENAFFRQAAELAKPETCKYEQYEDFSRSWVRCLERVVDQYHLVVAEFRASPAWGSLLQVERSSRETLLMWCAYCLVHKASLPFEFGVLADFDVSLQATDLRHLVLSDKCSIAAAQHVAAYLNRHTKYSRPAFSLRAKDCTLELASKHSLLSPDTQELWQAEQSAAADRQREHWEAVQSKQTMLVELDRELTQLGADLARATKARDRRDENYQTYKYQVEQYNSDAAVKRREISETEIPPDPIYQPLPKSDSLAMPVLFFLTMPEHFQVLSRLSFAAQQMLLPNDGKLATSLTPTVVDVVKHVRCDNIKTNCREYYTTGSSFGHLSKDKVVSTAVLLGSSCKVPESGRFSPGNVRHFRTQSDGVWHPDSLEFQIYWTGDSFPALSRGGVPPGSCLNPFAPLRDAVLVEKFTERLPSSSSGMQWTMPLQDCDPSRGNVPEARQDTKPSWLVGKTDFLVFGTMRAYPHQQARKICTALNQRSLPLDDPATWKMLQQTLYQLGNLTDGEDPKPIWRTDLSEHGGWGVLCRELVGLADELQQKPRQHGAVRILGELSAHASQWHDDARRVARRYGQIASDFAGEGVSKARCSVLAMYTVMCHCAGQLEKEDVKDLCKAVLVAEYCRLFDDSDPSPLHDVKNDLTVTSLSVMARQLPELFRVLDHDPSPLTQAVAAVLPSLTPPTLNWSRASCDGQPTTCYEAVTGPDQHLFSVNLQTGVVLYDGLPPRHLPKTILDQTLYKRSFFQEGGQGVCNFEVALRSGLFATVGLHGSRRYEFFVNAADRLVIREVDLSDPSRSLELLDVEEGEGALGSQLPIRLRHMHSHWYCEPAGVIILRRRHFSCRDVQFILRRGEGKDWQCFRIPEHKAMTRWTDLVPLLTTFERLVLPSASKTLSVLRKFDGIVHAYKGACNSSLFLEMPRFRLGFELVNSGKHRGRLRSMNFQGFLLAAEQQLDDALVNFCQYLMLESESDEGSRLVAPAGKVVRSSGGVEIQGPADCDADCQVHTYEVHPRFHTPEARDGATAIEARLQLAALYAATGTMLTEGRSGCTGGEMAMELVRQSWKGGPLNREEQDQLDSIQSFSQLTPALPLLCYEISASAQELMCLWPGTGDALDLPYDDGAASEYALSKQTAQLSPRAFLTPDEEQLVLGAVVNTSPQGTLSPRRALEVKPRESERLAIEAVEETLRTKLLQESPPETPDDTKFPLDVTAQTTEIGRRTLADLSRSWEAYHRLPRFHLAEGVEQLQTQLDDLQRDVTKSRKRLEHYCLSCIDGVPASDEQRVAFTMQRAANLHPLVTLRDLVKAACEPDRLLQLNPFLSERAVSYHLRPAILEWLELCALEDKLLRMVVLAKKNDKQRLVRELLEVGREWAVENHPEWLVFEVEQRLQIRKVQYIVACACIQGTGQITQFNMGEGKTRVILPMLVLHLAKPCRLVRLHFLPFLIDEAYQYLHRHLTASLLCRRLLRLPFHRDVRLEAQDVEGICHSLQRCMESCGAVCVAPEHRLSRQLKWQEVWENNNEEELEEVEELLQKLPTLDELPYFDVLDESDEILSHKYQLVYACGDCVQLPAGRERWRAVQLLIKLLQNSGEVADLLRTPNVAKRISMSQKKGAGALDDVRLLPGAALDNIRRKLLQILVQAVVKNLPYHLKCRRESKVIEEFIIDPTKSLAWLEEQQVRVKEPQRNQLLAFRGLLATGMLERCMSRRPRVDYGVDERRGRRCRVAVPFRASDTPADRAEYAQPDVMIMLTHLAYYHSGISREQITEALEALLKEGPMAQETLYGLWLESARPGMTEAQVAVLDNVSKLDVTNEGQLDQLHGVYRYNMEAINFWLEKCVLPRETMQFPSRLCANAFNLADNPRGEVVGFSGTKDNHLLLPFQVSQRVPEGASELLATDGRMCAAILRNKEVVCLDTTACTLSDAVIRLALKKGAAALIDAGAAMAGHGNRSVAKSLVDNLPLDSRLRGVTYFDSSLATWCVLDRAGRSCPLSQSPIHESDCIVYFDESHCRGTDMKMRVDAQAVITVGPDMGKEKLMQAAGRMRELERGQRLLFAVPPELVSQLSGQRQAQEGANLTSQDLLMWLVDNTARAIAAGLPQFLAQASHFCHCCPDPQARRLDEVLKLDELYGGAIGEQRVSKVVKNLVNRDTQRCEKVQVTLTETSLQLQDQIKKHADRYGHDLFVTSACDEEECERELENERELEQEREKQVPRQAPACPRLWDFSRILTTNNPLELDKATDVGVTRLDDAMKYFLQVDLTTIQWSFCHIFVTKAFMETVVDSQGGPLDDLSEFMRPPDALAIFPDGQALLLSEWEAEQIIPLMWDVSETTRSAAACPFIVNMVHLREAADTGLPAADITLRVPASALPAEEPEVEDITVAGLQLFAGETMFRTKQRQDSIKRLTCGSPSSRRAALDLVSLRGKQHMIACSDLERICAVDLGEVEED